MHACRSQEAAATTQHNLSQLQQRCDELAAENRVLMEGSRSMRHECNEAWVSGQPIPSSACSSLADTFCSKPLHSMLMRTNQKYIHKIYYSKDKPWMCQWLHNHFLSKCKQANSADTRVSPQHASTIPSTSVSVASLQQQATL